jgi:hypothetical protein
MKLHLLAPVAVVLLAGCPSDNKNPSRLWLALNGSEVNIKLDDREPPYI